MYPPNRGHSVDTEEERSNVAQCQSGAGTSRHTFHFVLRGNKIVGELQRLVSSSRLENHYQVYHDIASMLYSAHPTISGFLLLRHSLKHSVASFILECTTWFSPRWKASSLSRCSNHSLSSSSFTSNHKPTDSSLGVFNFITSNASDALFLNSATKSKR